MDKVKIEKNNELRNACLNNVKELLRAADLLLENKIDHIAFHLSALALEEIGKIGLSGFRLMSEDWGEEKEMNFDFEDHEKKLFWAIWGRSFGREKITQSQIEQQQHLAKNIHERRKFYLYIDPENPLFWQDKIEQGEGKMLYDFVYARYQLEEASSGFMMDMPEEDKKILDWFLTATSDPQKRKEIFGNKSQEKLLELGDVKKWIPWLKKVYDEHELEMKELVQNELSRKKPATKEEAKKNKWRVKIKIISPSHSIRSKALNEFNAHSLYIKLYKKDTNTLYIDMYYPKAVPVFALWEHGWGMTRMFVAALNIATRGLFWWNVPIDISKYYEEIFDMETNTGVGVELNPRLALNWKEARLVLGNTELSITGLVFSYITYLWLNKSYEAINLYITGLSLLAKNDVHLRLELNSFEQFYLSLKKALELNGLLDGKADLKEVLYNQINWMYKGDRSKIDKIVDLGEQIIKSHSGKVTLTEVISIKTYCDIYFIKSAKEFHEKRKGKKIRFVVDEVADGNIIKK